MNILDKALPLLAAPHRRPERMASREPVTRLSPVKPCIGLLVLCAGVSAPPAFAQTQQEMLDFMNKQKAEMCSPPAAGMEDVCAMAEQGRQILLRDMQGASAAPRAPAPAFTSSRAPARQTGQPASRNNHPELAASECLAIKPGTRGTLINQCGYPVQFSYCVVNSNNAFSCPSAPDSHGFYGKGSGSLRPGGEESGPGVGQFDSQSSLQVLWVACRGALGEVLPFLTNLRPPQGLCR